MCRRTVLFILISVVLTGCTTYRDCGYQNDSCGNDTVAVGELQDRVYEYGESIERFKSNLDAIRERATGDGVSIDGVIELFAEYDRAVGILIQDYYSLRARIGTEGNAIGTTVDRP